jgi:hypothetical protein
VGVGAEVVTAGVGAANLPERQPVRCLQLSANAKKSGVQETSDFFLTG